jgi:hypothetical protein
VTDKLKRTLALALAGGSLAIGVPAALAAGGGDDNTSGGQQSGPAFIQEEGQGQQERPDRGSGGPGDCPEKDGGQGGSGESGSSSATPDSGSATEI